MTVSLCIIPSIDDWCTNACFDALIQLAYACDSICHYAVPLNLSLFHKMKHFKVWPKGSDSTVPYFRSIVQKYRGLRIAKILSRIYWHFDQKYQKWYQVKRDAADNFVTYNYMPCSWFSLLIFMSTPYVDSLWYYVFLFASNTFLICLYKPLAKFSLQNAIFRQI